MSAAWFFVASYIGSDPPPEFSPTLLSVERTLKDLLAPQPTQLVLAHQSSLIPSRPLVYLFQTTHKMVSPTPPQDENTSLFCVYKAFLVVLMISFEEPRSYSYSSKGIDNDYV